MLILFQRQSKTWAVHFDPWGKWGGEYSANDLLDFVVTTGIYA